MSVSTIGTRLEQLQTMVAQLTAPAAPAPAATNSFAGALASAQTSPTAAPARAPLPAPPSEPRSMRPRQATGSTRPS